MQIARSRTGYFFWHIHGLVWFKFKKERRKTRRSQFKTKHSLFAIFYFSTTFCTNWLLPAAYLII